MCAQKNRTIFRVSWYAYTLEETRTLLLISEIQISSDTSDVPGTRKKTQMIILVDTWYLGTYFWEVGSSWDFRFWLEAAARWIALVVTGDGAWANFEELLLLVKTGGRQFLMFQMWNQGILIP